MRIAYVRPHLRLWLLAAAFISVLHWLSSGAAQDNELNLPGTRPATRIKPAVAINQVDGHFDNMSAMGQLAQAVAKARAHQPRDGNGSSFHGHFTRTFIGNGEDGDGDGPVGGQAEVSIAVDAAGQHIVVGVNDTRGFGLNPIGVSGFAYSDDG